MKFSNEAVCMDRILVLDDFGEGVPVGWVISNHEDTPVTQQFLLRLGRSVGKI